MAKELKWPIRVGAGLAVIALFTAGMIVSCKTTRRDVITIVDNRPVITLGDWSLIVPDGYFPFHGDIGVKGEKLTKDYVLHFSVEGGSQTIMDFSRYRTFERMDELQYSWAVESFGDTKAFPYRVSKPVPDLRGAAFTYIVRAPLIKKKGMKIETCKNFTWLNASGTTIYRLDIYRPFDKRRAPEPGKDLSQAHKKEIEAFHGYCSQLIEGRLLRN